MNLKASGRDHTASEMNYVAQAVNPVEQDSILEKRRNIWIRSQLI
mgnify:CR=1 FL=1